MKCASCCWQMDDKPSNPRPTPRWLDPDGGRSHRVRRSKGHENRIAKSVNGTRLPASGAVAISKWSSTTARGDIGTVEFHIEHKYAQPSTKSIGVQRSWLSKVTGGAKTEGKTPAMVLTFERPQKHPQDWLLIPLSVAKELGIFEDD